MHRRVHHDRVGEPAGQPVDRGLAAVGGPLSTIQNIRFADAYGSVVMTCSTNAMNAMIPSFVPSQRRS